MFLFTRFAVYKEPVSPEPVEQPLSVIVCARDEAGNLAKYLPGILFQDYKTTHEVIVVNDNSIDETKYILDEFRKSFKNLHL